MKCEICGKEIKESKFSNAILCSSECHTMQFWLEKAKSMQEDKEYASRIAIIDRNMYYIDDEDAVGPLGSTRGFGGREFIIKFKDGRIVKTTNLWANGSIPHTLLNKFPDNAEWGCE